MANKVINRGDACVDDGFTDDQRADVFTAAVGGEFSCAADGAGGKVLSGAGCQRGPGCQECTDRAEFALGGACHEEVLCSGGGPGGSDLYWDHWLDQGDHHL